MEGTASYNNNIKQENHPKIGKVQDLEMDMDRLLLETERLALLVDNIEDQTEREVLRLERVLDTFARDPQNDNDYNYYNIDGSHNRNYFTCRYFRNKLKHFNNFTKRCFTKPVTRRKNSSLLFNEFSRSVSELERTSKYGIEENGTCGSTSDLPLARTLEDEVFQNGSDSNVESVLSESPYKGRRGYSSYVKYKLMNYLSTTKRDDLVYMKESEDVCSPYLLYVKTDGVDTPIHFENKTTRQELRNRLEQLT
ncbi:hypothetical protein, no similarity [Maudiozyma barnettii]|uniref:Uncharacterized protein n=1 Tax=Maudiozyma barnettii TaxID=61262 RepID=A0A8H2VD32_9SACH|nr:hypothetical protein, no similarity [Kazachstania barnettii]CAB4253071.1 hypothetical protein, no similarity [Kazachstania barnettii]CAD1780394.1 hypothetical protein, no similarity [Kazachstania barnettii]